MQDRLLAIKLQKELDVGPSKGAIQQLADVQDLGNYHPFDECVICLEKPASAGFVHGER